MAKDRKEYDKKWRESHKEERKKYRQEWYKKNKETKKEKYREYSRNYYHNHKKEIKEYKKEYHEENKVERNKEQRNFYKKGRVFYGYNPLVLSRTYHDLTHPESPRFSPTIAKMSLETYIAMRAVFNSKEINSLMHRLYRGSILLEEIEDMISAAGFDMNSEEFKELIKCVCNNRSVRSFYKSYNGGEFK